MDEIIDHTVAVEGNEAAANAAPEIVSVAAVAAIAAESAPASTKTVRHQRKKSSVNTVSAEIEITTVVTDDVEAMPVRVTLASPYAFYDDAGALQSWAAGQVVDDSVVIAVLVDSGAIFEAE
ncbi:MAG: hypothetical protein HHJ15_18110 [Rhodoferax sp.]|uniref:hypothetical protein n=1 Tax=Rhodoferax sp. TaxID=50421 RepID=UPI0018134D9D|nr:hypothetical protein [Rhodoferax sp.]NMM21837.1 hypothetical protein [Rhodoferax sp.]